MSRFAPTSIPDSNGAADLGFNAPLAPQVGLTNTRSSVSEVVSGLANTLGIVVNANQQKKIQAKELDKEEQDHINSIAKEDLFRLQQQYNDLKTSFNQAVSEGNESLAAELQTKIDREVPLFDDKLNRLIGDKAIGLPIRVDAESFLGTVYTDNQRLIEQTRLREDKRIAIEKQNLYDEQFDFALADLQTPEFLNAVAGTFDELEGASLTRSLYSQAETKMREAFEQAGLPDGDVSDLLADPVYKKTLRARVGEIESAVMQIRDKALTQALKAEEEETEVLVVGSGVDTVIGSLSVLSSDNPVEFFNDNSSTVLELGYAKDHNDAMSRMLDGVITEVNRLQSEEVTSLLIDPTKLEQLIPLAANTGKVEALQRTIVQSYQAAQKFAATGGTLEAHNKRIREYILDRNNGEEDLLTGQDKKIYDLHPVVSDKQSLPFINSFAEIISDDIRQRIPTLPIEQQNVVLGTLSAKIVNEVTLANGKLNNKFIDAAKKGLESNDPLEYLVTRQALEAVPELQEVVFAEFTNPEDRVLAELSFEIPFTEEDRLDPSARLNRLRGYVQNANTLINSKRMSEAIKTVYNAGRGGSFSVEEFTRDPIFRENMLEFIARQYIETPDSVLQPFTTSEVKTMLKDFTAGVSVNTATGRVERFNSEQNLQAFQNQYSLEAYQESPLFTPEIQDKYYSVMKEWEDLALDYGYGNDNSRTYPIHSKYFDDETIYYSPEVFSLAQLSDNIVRLTSLKDRLPKGSETEVKGLILEVAANMLDPKTEYHPHGQGGRSFTVKQGKTSYFITFDETEWKAISKGASSLKAPPKVYGANQRFLQLYD